MNKKDLFSIPGTPFKGLFPDRHPLALKPGEVLDAVNVRADDGSPITTRNGVVQELDTAGLPANAVFRGASPMIKVQEGFWLLYLAAEDPADQKVHVYNRQFTTASGWGDQWHELTASTGPFGDTRLSKSPVTFTPVDSDQNVRAHLTYLGPTSSQGPAVVAQNGIDRPLHLVGFPGASTTDFRAVPIKSIETPNQARATVAEAGVLDSLPVRTGNVTPAATANGTFTAATGGHVQRAGTAGDYRWEWKAGATVTVGDTGDIVLDTEDMDLHSDGRTCPQIGLVVGAEDDSWWDCVKLYAHVDLDGAGYAWVPVHDPTANADSAKNNRVHVETNIEGTVVSAYAFERRTGLLSAKMNGLRIEVASDRLTPGTTFKVHWVYASGWIPGTAQYAVSCKAALSEAESGGVLIGSGAFGLDTTTMRGPWESYNAPATLEDGNARFLHPAVQGGSLPPEFVFPVDPRLFFVYRVPAFNPTLAQLAETYVDTWCVYRKDPGESDFLLVANVQMATWTGAAWDFTTNPDEGALFYWADHVAPEDRDARRRAPDPYTEVTPVGSCAVYANKRQYVGAAQRDSSGTNVVGNVVMVSEEGYPGRFRARVRFDDDDLDQASGYEARLGIEEVRSLAAMDGATDSSRVLVLTDRSLYSLERSSGFRLFNVRRLALFGAAARVAHAESKDEFIWWDDTRALRTTRGLVDLSHGRVQTRLDTIADAASVRLAVHRGRLYVAREDRVLVYGTGADLWESDDQLTVAVAQFVTWDARLFFFSPDCRLLEYGRAGETSDDGEAIPFALETHAVHNSMFLPIAAGRMSVVASVAPAVLTTKRIFSEPAATVPGQIDLDTGGALVWRFDRLAGGGTPGGEGQAVRFRIEGDFDTAFELLALAAETQNVPLGGAGV